MQFDQTYTLKISHFNIFLSLGTYCVRETLPRFHGPRIQLRTISCSFHIYSSTTTFYISLSQIKSNLSLKPQLQPNGPLIIFFSLFSAGPKHNRKPTRLFSPNHTLNPLFSFLLFQSRPATKHRHHFLISTHNLLILFHHSIEDLAQYQE